MVLSLVVDVIDEGSLLVLVGRKLEPATITDAL